MSIRWWFGGRRSRSRIIRDLSVARVEFVCLCANNPAFAAMADAIAVKTHLQDAETFCMQSDIEGAWGSLHAAQRAILPGITAEELSARIISLQAESMKLPEWRRDAVHLLLKKADTASVQAAMRLRDEYSANLYHKIWLTSDQFKFLVCACLFGLILATPVGFFIHTHGPWSHLVGDKTLEVPPTWSFTMLSTVIGIGICGGCFSVGLSMFSNMKAISIPERVANQWTTSIRAIFGGISGLAGYAFAHIGLFTIGKGDTDSIAFDISTAFLFGYTGERLIARIVASTEDTTKQANGA
jgi:hypothetical protein